MSDETMAYITEDDLQVIERIAEYTLDSDIKDFLLSEFGKDGLRMTVYENSLATREACDSCPWCVGCGACAPYRDDLLIVELARIISAYKTGDLNLATGEIKETNICERCSYAEIIPF